MRVQDEYKTRTASEWVGKIVRLRFTITTKSLRDVPAGHRFRVSSASLGKLVLVECPPLLTAGQVLYLSKVPPTDIEEEPANQLKNELESYDYR